jgi:hypothetical protein
VPPPGGLSQSPENVAGRPLFMRDKFPGYRFLTRTTIGQHRHCGRLAGVATRTVDYVGEDPLRVVLSTNLHSGIWTKASGRWCVWFEMSICDAS